MKSKRILFSVLFLCNLLFLLWMAGCTAAGNDTVPVYSHRLRETTGDQSIIFVSDTQSPLFIEKLRLKADRNEEATKLILNAIGKDSSCVALFHLGDITALGGMQSFWQKFDKNAFAIRNAGIPIFPAFGNHEYYPTAERGKMFMFEHFPFLQKKSWYYERVGRVAVVLFNSNFSKLSSNDLREQQGWFKSTLQMLDADTSVSIVIVGCHHPPYTNSTIVDPSQDIRDKFLPAFDSSKKAKLFITGHSHAFEHFKIGDKNFLVIGGGGGLLHPLLMGSSQRTPDQFKGEERRFFHYVKMIPQSDRLVIQIEKVNSTYTGFENIYNVEIPY